MSWHITVSVVWSFLSSHIHSQGTNGCQSALAICLVHTSLKKLANGQSDTPWQQMSVHCQRVTSSTSPHTHTHCQIIKWCIAISRHFIGHELCVLPTITGDLTVYFKAAALAGGFKWHQSERLDWLGFHGTTFSLVFPPLAFFFNKYHLTLTVCRMEGVDGLGHYAVAIVLFQRKQTSKQAISS